MFTKKHKLVFLILVEGLLIYLISILGQVPSSSGYETSIYAMYPSTFWITYFVICLSSLCMIMYLIFIDYDHLCYCASLFNLSILTSVILLLPFLRGYLTIDMTDTLIHLGHIRDILSTNHLAQSQSQLANPYPLAHILSANIIQVTQISLETIGKITGPLYYLVYALFAYLLTRTVYESNGKAVLVLLFILIPILHSYPYYMSLMFFFLVPMLLYVLVKDMKTGFGPFRYIVLIMILFLPIMHPASSLLLLMVFAIICTVAYLTVGKKFALLFGKYISLLYIFLIVWFVWATSLVFMFRGWSKHFLNWLTKLSEQSSYYAFLTTGLEKAELPIVDAIALYLRLFGPIHLLLGMALLFSVYTIYKRTTIKNNQLGTALSLIFLAYIAIYLVSLFYTLPPLGGRIYTYVILVAIFVNANFLFDFVKASKTRIKQAVSLIFVATLLFSMTCSATFGLYGSPFVRKPPRHGTYMYFDSVQWLLQTRNVNLHIAELDYLQWNATVYLLGYRKALSEPNLGSLGSPRIIPDHFNYPNDNLLGNTLKKDCYLIINKKDELVSTSIYPEYEDRWSFTPDDYRKLEHDRSLTKIYQNREIKVFYVNYVGR